jgi:adenylate cyclase
MAMTDELEATIQQGFDEAFEVSAGSTIPDVADLVLSQNRGRELDLAMLFIDIRSSTKIVDGFRRTTAAKMYKSFLTGVTRIVRNNGGQVVSFNGDGVLAAFCGVARSTVAAKTALNLSWLCTQVLRPKLRTYFEKNHQLADVEFDFGIGIDSGKVLVVRAGIGGSNNNDLVWVGNPTNYSVKLAGWARDPYNVYIFEPFFKEIEKAATVNPDNGSQSMWEQDPQNLYLWRSSWWWKPAASPPKALSLAGLLGAYPPLNSPPTGPRLRLPPPPPIAPAKTLAQLLAEQYRKK